MSSTPEVKKFQIYCCTHLDCGKEYGSKFNLKRHIEIFHLRAKQVECLICHKTFRIKQNLIEHSYIHTKSKPYFCYLCGDRFRHKSTLLNHTRNKLCS